MKKTAIDDVHGAFIIEGSRFGDDRGWFQEFYSTAHDYPHLVGQQRQINLSCSRRGVVRGMHIAPFAKLCTCVRGRVYDVITDLRESSPTYLKWYATWLDEHNKLQLFVPAGCAHGFFAEQDDSIFLYLQDDTYNPRTERQVNWREPKIGIVWPPCQEYILSERDRTVPLLA